MSINSINSIPKTIKFQYLIARMNLTVTLLERSEEVTVGIMKHEEGMLLKHNLLKIYFERPLGMS